MTQLQRAALSGAQILAETVIFRGHPMVRSLHPTTIEVTTEGHLTPRGDCIIGVGATKGCAQLSEALREALRRKDSRVAFGLLVGEHRFEFTAEGDPGLSLSHPKDIVIRKSRFVSDRTVAVGSSAAAKDIPRQLVARLRDPKTVGVLEIRVS